jgi:hypothetical protein
MARQQLSAEVNKTTALEIGQIEGLVRSRMEENSPQIPSARQGGDNLGQKVIAYKWHLRKDDLLCAFEFSR